MTSPGAPLGRGAGCSVSVGIPGASRCRELPGPVSGRPKEPPLQPRLEQQQPQPEPQLGWGGSGAPRGCAWARRQQETTDFLPGGCAAGGAQPALRGHGGCGLCTCRSSSRCATTSNGPAGTRREPGPPPSLGTVSAARTGTGPSAGSCQGPTAGLCGEGRASRHCWPGALGLARALPSCCSQRGQGLFPPSPTPSRGRPSPGCPRLGGGWTPAPWGLG